MHPIRPFRCTTLFLCLMAISAKANNIQVANINLTDNGGGMATVQFDLGWENSWRGGGVSNWDAAWVFVKYKFQGDGGMTHMYLDPTGQQYPTGAVIDHGLLSPASPHDPTSNPVVGVFIRRDADGTGTFNAIGTQLTWNYGALGVSFVDIVEVRVYAIEMVHMNQGAFHIGSGGNESNAFRRGGSTAPFHITSEAAIALGNNASQLTATEALPGTSLPAAFPKGYAAAYLMKYECSQQQYVDFLNSLGRAQQAARVESNIALGVDAVAETYVMTATTTLTDRNGIRCPASIEPNGTVHFYCDANGNGVGGEADDGQWVAMNNIGARDVFAYLDWSGLRPMTELEFEKACRGPLPPVANEYPWRTATIAPSGYTLGNAFAANEGIATGYSTIVGNAVYGLGDSFRVGIFSAHPSNTGRVSSGAGYYGAMELAGNQFELVISAGNAAGQAYTGNHGNGELASAGGHDPEAWPLLQDGSPQIGWRGGGISGTPGTIDRLRVSDREFSTNGNHQIRLEVVGGRGVRTAP